MIPGLSGGVDHIHVYVPSRREAAAWYASHLGFHTVEALSVWTGADSGPLTIADAGDRIHLALFRAGERKPVSLAFGASAEQYLAWLAHLDRLGMSIREADHDLCWSLYFDDPFGNQIEITSYEVDALRAQRARSARP